MVFLVDFSFVKAIKIDKMSEDKSSRPDVFCKKVVPKNLTNCWRK